MKKPGLVPIALGPPDVGSRFGSASQGSGIASETSQPKNFTWTVAS